MACSEEYSRLISLYPLSEDQTPEERAKLEAHIQECAECRADLEKWREFLNLICSAKGVKAPQGVLDCTHANITAAIRRRAAMKRLLRVACFVPAIAAAAVTIAAYFGAFGDSASKGTAAPDQPAIVAEKPGEQPAKVEESQLETAVTPDHDKATDPFASVGQPEADVPVVAERELSLEDKFAQIDDPAKVLALLKAELKAAEADPQGGDPEGIIALAERLGERWPGSPESVDAIKLISRCHTQMGELDKAREVFLSYADALGKAATKRGLARGLGEEKAATLGEESTVDAVREETSRLFRETDYTSALAFCDVMRTRWSGKEAGFFGQFLTARCYGDTRQYDDAEQEYRQIIAEHPTSEWATRARRSLPVILANRGRMPEAVLVCQQWADMTDDRQAQATAYYFKGCYLMAMGEEHYPAALQAWQWVVNEYPDAKCLRSVKGMIAKLNNKVTGHIGRHNP